VSTVIKPKINNGVVDINPLIDACVEHAESRKLGNRSCKEIRFILSRLSAYCTKEKINSIHELTPALLQDFILEYPGKNSAAQVKPVVWVLRKFGAFLALLQLLPDNPARHLSHPKHNRREKLPNYLRPNELSTFLETTVNHFSKTEQAAICLLAIAGLRPHELGELQIKDLFLSRLFIYVKVKGGWYRQTPIATTLADILQDCLVYEWAHKKADAFLFINTWNKTIDNRWSLRLVKKVTKKAGIKRNITPLTLRHTFATYAADRHGKIVTRDLLGHCPSSHSTDVYMHLVPSKFQQLSNGHPYQTTLKRSC